MIYLIGAQSQFQQFGNGTENPKQKKEVIPYSFLFFDQTQEMYKSQLLFYQKHS